VKVPIAWKPPSKREAIPETSVLHRIFRGPPDARFQELKEHVLFLFHNRGMQDLLTTMIAVLEGTTRGEPYMERLIVDLKTTLKNYKARHGDEV